jgi:hypothetical protein
MMKAYDLMKPKWFLCFFIYYTFYYTKQSYLHGRIWNNFISSSKFIDKGSLVLYYPVKEHFKTFCEAFVVEFY